MIEFVNEVGATVPEAGFKVGCLGWLVTFSSDRILYWTIVVLWPRPNVKNIKA